MRMYHKFYIKLINLDLEVVQPIYVQKITNFGNVGMLNIKDVDIYLQGVFGFSCT